MLHTSTTGYVAIEVNPASVIDTLNVVFTSTWANTIIRAGINAEGTASIFINEHNYLSSKFLKSFFKNIYSTKTFFTGLLLADKFLANFPISRVDSRSKLVEYNSLVRCNS